MKNLLLNSTVLLCLSHTISQSKYFELCIISSHSRESDIVSKVEVKPSICALEGIDKKLNVTHLYCPELGTWPLFSTGQVGATTNTLLLAPYRSQANET